MKTKTDKMVAAAVALMDEDGKETFTSEDLVVKAWRLYPTDFALNGYPEHPDSNAIFSKIMGKSSPLVAGGYLEKLGVQKFRATPKAFEKIRELRAEERATATNGATRRRVGRGYEQELARLFGTAAWQCAVDGARDSITFYQFCRFFDLDARGKWQAVMTRLEQVAAAVHYAEEVGTGGEPVYVPRAGKDRAVSPDELCQLGDLHRHLTDRFKNEMAAWERRAGPS